MKLSDILKSIYKSRGHSIKSWSALVGVSSGVISKLLVVGNAKVESLLTYLAPLGYTVAVVPTGCKLPDGCYVVEPRDAPEPVIDLDDPNLMLG